MSLEIENKFIETLRNYGIHRQRKVLEPIAVLTNRSLENNSLFHVTLCMTTLMVIIATYAQVVCFILHIYYECTRVSMIRMGLHVYIYIYIYI